MGIAQTSPLQLQSTGGVDAVADETTLSTTITTRFQTEHARFGRADESLGRGDDRRAGRLAADLPGRCGAGLA